MRDDGKPSPTMHPIQSMVKMPPGRRQRRCDLF
jgi:hypothetical protein